MNQSLKTSTNITAHILAVLAVIMWGYSFVSSKVLLQNGLGPTQIYICRFFIAYVIILCFSHKRLFCRNLLDEFLLMLCGLLSGSLYYIAENTALEYTYATNVALLTALSPLLMVLIVACVYKNEKISAGTWIGTGLAVVGVACVVFNGSADVKFGPIGDLLSILAALSWSIYCLILRKLNAIYDVWFITRKTFFYGLVTALPFLMFSEGESLDIWHLLCRTPVWSNLVFLGLGPSTAAFLIWGYIIKKLGTITANNYLYGQPVVTLIVSAIIIHEQVSFVGVLGIILIIGGLWLGDYLTRMNFGARN